MTDIFEYLSARSYPGRGILIGSAPDGGSVCAYFIMGRSANSRNRVFESTEDGIRTRAYNEELMTDPSLIIYNPVRRFNGSLIVTNGDQTDTIRDALAGGGSFESALRTREFEPDAPNFTPRVSGVALPDGSFKLSILKTEDGERCDRLFYEYAAAHGEGRFISTYEGFGEPRPSFTGEPVRVAIPELGVYELSFRLWESLNTDNRVSLYVNLRGTGVIINRFS